MRVVSSLVINLDRRADRLVKFNDTYQRSDLASEVPLARIAATDGSVLDMDALLTPTAAAEMAQVRAGKPRMHHTQLTPGAVGCYLSHLDAWRVAARSPGPVVIFEDDVIVPERMLQRLNLAVNEAAAVAGGKPFVLALHIICLKDCEMLPSGFVKPTMFWSTAANVVTPESARALLAMMDSAPIDIQIDGRLGELAAEGRIVFLARPMIKIEFGGTDIQVNTTLRAPLTRSGAMPDQSADKRCAIL
jgi:GR25 family glycosyltransferase involved in LPS biosynthesis